jgi:dipeptidyl aminopeptidase/acylaminoacyl peptidase
VAVAALNPVLDLADMPAASSSVMKFLGGRCADRAELCREASPADHASPNAAPMLILHGTADQSVPYRQAEAMTAKLRAAGAQVELFTAPDAGHTFWSKPEWYEPSLHAMEHFLLHYLLPGVP